MAVASKKNRKQAEYAFAALRDLFSKHLLQDRAQLTAFQHNPTVKGRSEEDIANFELIDAYFGHCIKEIYRDYVTNLLVDLSKDDLDYYRKMALDILVDLISSKPEIEEIILGILINKLGDTSKKV